MSPCLEIVMGRRLQLHCHCPPHMWMIYLFSNRNPSWITETLWKMIAQFPKSWSSGKDVILHNLHGKTKNTINFLTSRTRSMLAKGVLIRPIHVPGPLELSVHQLGTKNKRHPWPSLHNFPRSPTLPACMILGVILVIFFLVLHSCSISLASTTSSFLAFNL